MYEVTRERTCSAVLRMCNEGSPNPMALVFASAKKPGGGFLTGAAAQEESVCRCSGLYKCLKVCEQFSFHTLHLLLVQLDLSVLHAQELLKGLLR